MEQHNHWKLGQLQKRMVKPILGCFGALLLFCNFVLKKPLTYEMVSTAISVMMLVLAFILSLLERTLWKTRIMSVPFLENYWTPVLAGRWEGKFTRDGEKHDFVIEIKQSFTTVSCVTYSNHSSSAAYAAEILYNDHHKNYQLIYYWQGKTATTQKGTGDSNTFDGFTVLDIIIQEGKVIKLKGEYFTNRQPNQTKGTLEVTGRQEKLKNAF